MYHQVKKTNWILIQVFCLPVVNKILTNLLIVICTLIHENDIVGRLTMRSTRWRVEFQENLARKDAEEKMKMEELKAKAKKELEDW